MKDSEKALNINIDKNIKVEFKTEVARLGTNMSTVTEALIDYWLELTEEDKLKFLESK